MTAFERQKLILNLLRDQPGVQISELAEHLGVSQGTIRNDLSNLERAGKVSRVRGGAVLKEGPQLSSPSFAARARINAQAKQRIARMAADLVEDGDTLMLDASTTVYSMVPYLKKNRNLTVVTNGISVGVALSQNPSNTVILIGGVIRPTSDAVTGHLAEKIIEGLHVKTAFVSCSGCSVEAGLTEVDIHEIEIKRTMIRSAERVIALVDSSKFGRVDLSSFASLEQVSQIFTDSEVSPKFIEEFRRGCTTLTVCGEDTVSSFIPCLKENNHFRIGFACLGESLPFAVDVRRGLERAAKEAGDIDLVLADNRLDGETALRVADMLIAEGVGLVIEYQIDEKLNNVLMTKFRQADIPVIAVDIPMTGATFLGVDNYQAGHMAGLALGRRILSDWDGQVEAVIVLEEPRAGSVPAARIHGQLDGLQEVLGPLPSSRLVYLACGNSSEISRENVAGFLAGAPTLRRIAVVAFNDDAALGAIQAAQEAGRESDLLVVGQGADRLMREEIRRPDSRVVGSSAYWPEKYGEKLIEVGRKILKGEPVPPAVYLQPVFITQENINIYYPEQRQTHDAKKNRVSERV